jgi:molybdenum storage protein
VVKIGASSIVDKGRSAVLPMVAVLAKALEQHRLIIGTGGGARTRHVFSIGIDLGLPTGILAQLAMADANGNAHILGTLLAPHGVVAIPPEMFGHLLPLFLRAAPGVIFHGEPPYSLWEHPPGVGLYDRDPKQVPRAKLIREISTLELRKRSPRTLPFDEVLIDLLPRGRLVRSFQIVNGTKPELLLAALAGEHVGTIVHAD